MDLTDNVIEEVQKKEGLIASFLDTLPEKALNLGIRIGLALVFFFIGMQLIRLIRKIIRKSMNRAGAETGVIQFVDSFVKASLYIILILTLASSFGVDAASIVALLGSAGVAIGLAVQGSLSNLAGGVLILLLKPFKVGDYIVEGSSGKEGTVKEIQIFYTKLLQRRFEEGEGSSDENAFCRSEYHEGQRSLCFCGCTGGFRNQSLCAVLVQK